MAVSRVGRKVVKKVGCLDEHLVALMAVRRARWTVGRMASMMAACWDERLVVRKAAETVAYWVVDSVA